MANVFIDFIYRSKGAESVKKDLDGIQKSARSIEDTFVTIGKLGVAGLTVGALAEFAKNASFAADQARATNRTFVNLSDSAREAAENMEAMEAATRGLASATEQQEIANRLLAMGIVDTADELEKIVEGSRRLGKEFKGLGTAQAAEEFAILIANMSFQRLDSFGISSARVRKRIDELTASTKGLTQEQAFAQATIEEMQSTQERLGEETVTLQDKVDKVGASWANFTEKIGQVQNTSADTGLVFDEVAKALDGWGLIFDEFTPKVRGFNEVFRESILTLNFADFWDRVATATDDARKEYEAYTDVVITGENRIAKLRKSLQGEAPVQDERQLKRLANAERDALKELRNIDETFQQESTEAWDDYWTDLESLRNESAKRILALERNFTKQISRLTRNFNRDSERSAIRSSRSIERIRKDAAKKIERLEQDQRRRQKERQLDTLQDERLFQFELRNLAADGEFLAIQEAVQRREIEKQIEQEKNREKEQEEEQSLNTRIERIRQDAEDRIREEQAAARLAQQWRKEDFDARKAELEEQLKEEREAELASLNERELQLTAHYNEKLNLAMKSRDDALATLAEELTEMEGMTILRLSKIREAAESLGYESGTLFGQSFSDAINQFDIVSEALGQGRFTPGGGRGGGVIGGGLGGSRGIPLQFQSGGLAPVGVPSVVGEAGREVITPMNTINVSPTVNVSGANEDMVNGIVNTHIQNLVNELEGALAT